MGFGELRCGVSGLPGGLSTSAVQRSPSAQARMSRSCRLSASNWRILAVFGADHRWGRGGVALPEPFELNAQIVISREPGPGDAALASDGSEGDALAGGVHEP